MNYGQMVTKNAPIKPDGAFETRPKRPRVSLISSAWPVW